MLVSSMFQDVLFLGVSLLLPAPSIAAAVNFHSTTSGRLGRICRLTGLQSMGTLILSIVQLWQRRVARQHGAWSQSNMLPYCLAGSLKLGRLSAN